jgi:hypothetical protein
VLGCGLIYFSLFGVGQIIFGRWLIGLIFSALALACGYGIFLGLSRKADDDLWRKS